MLSIRRLALILLAYVVGCLSAGLLVAAVLGAFAEGVGLGTGPAIGSYIFAFALVPVGIAIAAGEVFHWRSVVFWIGVGVAVGVFAFLVLGQFTPGISERRPYLFVVAGVVWGAAYWLIAGRHSGGESRKTRD